MVPLSVKVKVIVPVGWKPPASVAESVSSAPLPSVTAAGPAVVVIVGLAGLDRHRLAAGPCWLTGLLLASPL